MKCAIVGATGVVGSSFLKVLEEKKLKFDEYILFSSKKSAGKIITFMNKEYVIRELTEKSFNEKIDYAIFSAGGEISKKYAKIASENGCIVIDNSSYFRMDKDVPLVVPEINLEDIKDSKIIASPNCSTIQASLPLKKLDEKYGLKRIVISTYQAVSGAGKKGIDDLVNTLEGKKNTFFPYDISKNCIPHIDIFLENGYTKEEMKMVNELKKILHKPNLQITATCVRVPILNCHSESLNIELEKDFNIDDIYNLFNNSIGIKVIDDVNNFKYPINQIAVNTDNVYVGRIRRDFSNKNTLNLWIVADNIRKGAASNVVQILEKIYNY